MTSRPAARKATVQDYIDETPFWPDGTKAPPVSMTRMQARIWLLASAGKFFEGLVVFLTGVALPLMSREFGLTAVEKGALGAAALLGILIGASALGGLSDRYGRKRMFIVEMALFAACLLGLVLSRNFSGVLIFLFGTGAAMTVFLFPVLLFDIGTRNLLFGLTATSLLGALATWFFGIETRGVNLERMDEQMPRSRR